MSRVAGAIEVSALTWLSGSSVDLISRLENGQPISENGLWLVIGRAQLEDDPNLAWHVCKSIGDNKYQSGANYLLFIGQREDVEFDKSSLHRIAAWSIGRLKVQPEILLPLLKSDQWQTRRFAADSLGEIGDPSVLDPLMDAFVDEQDEEVYKWIGLSLSKLSVGSAGGVVASRLSRSITGMNDQKRLWAIDSLSRIDR